MRVRGEVFSGVLRGEALIKKYESRLVGLLGFKPINGTLNIRIERNVDIIPFATKKIEHVMTNGRKIIDAYMAPVNLRKLPAAYKMMEIRDEEKQILENLEKLRKNAHFTDDKIEEPHYDYWAIHFPHGLYGNDTIELISHEMINEKVGLENGDKVELEFTERQPEKKRRSLVQRTPI